jgi:hypothetical protein
MRYTDLIVIDMETGKSILLATRRGQDARTTRIFQRFFYLSIFKDIIS